MRTTIIVGAAALALGATVTPAAADPFWFLGKVISECYEEGVYEKDSVQVECAFNNTDEDGYSNDSNRQFIKQDQFAKVWETPRDTWQIQIGVNNVNEGDYNKQKVIQEQALIGDPDDDDVQQLQVGVNNVEDGDNNSQTIKQSQTLIVLD